MKYRTRTGVRWLAAAVLAATLAPQTRADIGMRLRFWHNAVNFYGSVDLSTPTPAPITYHRIESPNGGLWDQTGAGYNNTLTNLGSFAALVDESTNGLWTLTLNVGDASEAVYNFSVDVAGVTPGMFGTGTVTEPANMSTVSNNPPTIQWTTTSSLAEVYINIVEDGPPYSFQDQATLPGTTTNWTPSAPLSLADQRIYLRYQTDDFSGFTISTPTNVVGGAAVPGWTSAGDLWSYSFSYFTVPGGGGNSALGDAVDAPELPWTTGGAEDWFDQTYETRDGIDAAASDLTGYPSAESWIETTVQGPGELYFAWGIFADVEDSLVVEVDGNYEDVIYGSAGWDDSGYVYISDPGPVTVRWTFYHYDVFGDPSEAFLDEVSYTPEPPLYDVEFNLRLQRSYRNGITNFLAFPSLANVSPPATTVHEVESPNELFSGGEGTSSSVNLTSLGAVIDECTNGVWTLYLNRGAPFEEQYTFSMSVLSLSANDFPPVAILDPLDGASGVSTDPNYMWTGPSSFDSLFVLVRDDEANSTVGYSSLPAATTSWDGPALADGTNTFSATYTSNNFMGLDITEPSGGYPLSSWFTTAEISTAAYSTFVTTSGFVPLPVTILPPVLLGGDLDLSFLSQSGATHVVECTTNLMTGPWNPVTNFPGNGTTNQITLPTTNPAAFYRVETQ